MKAAAHKMGVSYRKAWGDLKNAEKLLGYDLTVPTRGGKDGGNSCLTEKGIKLLEAYDALHSRMDDAVESAYQEFRQKINNK